MNHSINLSTQNPIVDAVGKINLTGNIIPESWYYTITNDKGKINPLAILILADIVYWYRPTEERDETTLSVSYSKKFHDENYLQRSYEQLMEKFNISKKQARDALIFLEDIGVVKRHFKNIVVAGLPLSNVMFLELVPDVLEKLTFPSGQFFDQGGNKNVTTPFPKSDEGITQTGTPPNEKVETYTKTSSNNTPNTSTQSSSTTLEDENLAFVVAEVQELFKEFCLPEKDIQSILSAADYDILRVKDAKDVFDQQTAKINNVTGWLIKAITEGYRPISKAPRKRDGFHNFLEREHEDDYWDSLELALLKKGTESIPPGKASP